MDSLKEKKFIEDKEIIKYLIIEILFKIFKFTYYLCINNFL